MIYFNIVNCADKNMKLYSKKWYSLIFDFNLINCTDLLNIE